MSEQDVAKQMVDDFATLPSVPTMWTNLDRAIMAAGLKERIDDPDKIDQGGTSLCGPADFVRDIAQDKPTDYAKAAIDLYKTGIAYFGTLKINPGKDLKKHALAATARIHPADWILLASIRDTDNWFFDYQDDSDDAAAITMPHSKESWLKSAGYSEVINDTNVVFCKDLASAAKASSYFKKGYKVALFINADMLDDKDMNNISVTPDHWVALTSAIQINSFNLTHPGALNEDKNSKISLEVYTWGSRRKVPGKGILTDYHFVSNYYGFIACRR